MRALLYGFVTLAASINWEKACVQVAPKELETKTLDLQDDLTIYYTNHIIIIHHDASNFSADW